MASGMRTASDKNYKLSNTGSDGRRFGAGPLRKNVASDPGCMICAGTVGGRIRCAITVPQAAAR